MSEEVDIPFKFVGTGVLTKLANKLDPLNHVTGNDWRLLAEKLGYSQDEIQVIEEQKHLDGRSTIKLLNNYIKKPGNSVEKVLKALQEMPRIDAHTILLEAVPKIQEFARQRQEEEERGEENSFSPFTPSDYYRSHPWAWPMMTHMPPMAHMPSMSPYFMSHSGIPFDSPYTAHGSPLHHPRAPKNPKVCHHPDSSNQCCSPHCYTRSYSHNGFVGMPPPPIRNGHPVLSPPSPVYNVNNGYPEIPGREYHSLEVNHSMYPDRQVSREISDPGHHFQEDPAPLARTIFKNQGHPLLSTNTRPVRSQSAEYNGDISDDDSLSTGSNPASPNNNRRHGHVTYDVRNDISDDIRINGVEVNRNDVNDIGRVRKDVPRELTERKIDNKKNGESSSGSGGEGNANKMDSKERNILRMKSMSTGHQMSNANGNVEHLENMMKKSLSLPNNMKPAEFRRVFNIKVFVTYSNDSDKHMQRVLNLCKCLEKNKFFCFVDMVYKENGKKDNLEDIRRKFEEADFVLVCSSKKYKENINAKINTDGLHTKFIYELIYDEFKEKGNHRCVPVILDGTSQSDIPTWLQSSMKYIWPSQYKDLLFMLTKPEQRITQHCARK
ncbi:hypothetical protein LOTGIDRAFT_233367 [Lottia gigantea]|uniref:Death domain-containing protein n=1 Tax=Lottia gigantea TaxID=225164 RepID=V4ADZ8_LOTGI|nr:hypothetical protein LOTGIDRAFT_233367 [Lottia gigantea]ESO91556.1 hypothetical protein LOTGIDRAFT_233367 [Lottia gigantea]